MAGTQTDAVLAGQELLPVIAQLETGGHESPDDAVSHSGAVGRYQIMPGTARQYGFEPERLMEPDYNKQVAGTILNDLWRRYHGDASAVLVAYNAGPSTANKWMASGRTMPLPTETTGYLDKASKLMTGGNLQRDVQTVAMDDGAPPKPEPVKRDSGIAPGRALIQKAIDAGYPAQDILKWKQQKTQDALAAGYKPDEIDAYFGESPPQIADAERLVKNNLSQVPVGDAQKLAANPLDAMRAGWGSSDIGLAVHGGLPETVMPMEASTSMKVAAAAGQFAGDLPATIGGFFLGSSAGAAAGSPLGPGGAAVGGIVGGGFGAGAVPQAIREALIAGYRRGEIHTFSDFAGVMGGATMRTLKAGVAAAIAAPLGVLGGKIVGGTAAKLAGAETIELAGAGSNEFLPYVVHNDVSRLVGAGADLATQTAVFGSVSAAMDGRMPDKSDFITGGMFALGFHVSARIIGGRQRPTAAGEAAAEGMEEVFRTTGHTPWEAAQAARTDPVLRQELLTIDVNGERVMPTWQANAKDEPTPFVKPEPLKLEPPKIEEGNLPPAPPAPPSPPGPPTPKDGEPPPQLDGPMLNEIASEFIGGEQKDRALDAAKMYRQWVSELGPARAIDKLLIARGLDNTRKLGVEDMFRQTYASDSRLGYFLQYGGIKIDIDAKGNVVFAHDNKAPAFKEIAKQVQKNGGNLSDWTNWMVAQRANDKEAQGFETGHPLTLAQRQQLIAIGQSKYKIPTKELQKISDSILEYARNSGVFSQEQVDNMRRDNPFYITFRRLMGEEKTIPPIRSGRNFRVMEPVKRFEGDERQIMNPIVALVDNWHTIVRMADRNRAVGSVVALAERHGILEELGLKQLAAPDIKATIAEPGSDIFKPYNLDPEASYETYAPFLAERANRRGAWGKDKFVFIRNGKVEVWKASDPAIAELMRGAESPGEANVVMNLAVGVARMNRAGIINAADFPVRNALRDQIATYVLDPNSPPPFLTWLKGAFEVFGHGERFKEWLRNGGGGGALVEMDKAYFHRGIAEILEDTGAAMRVWNTVRHPIEAAQLLSERIDAASRVGYTGHVGETRPDIEPVKAATQSRKAYLDFVEKGTLAFMQGWAKAVPFLRPSILGLKQTGEAIKGNPTGTLLKALTAITLPTVVLYALNYLQDEHGGLPEDQKYKNLPRWQKDGYFITPQIGGIRARLPMPTGGLGLAFGGLTNRALDHFAHNDPTAFKEWAQALAAQVIPPFIPTIILPATEWWANRSAFTGKPLVPESVQDATGPMQYTSATTEPAKRLSRVLNKIGAEVSPIVIENFVREWTGSVGMEALRALNTAMITSQRPWEITDLPFVQSFFVRNPGMNAQPIQDFYDVKDEFLAARRDLTLAMKGQFTGESNEAELQNAVDNLLPPGPIAAQVKYLQTMHTLVQAIENKPLITEKEAAEGKDGMTADDKRQQTDAIVSNMIVTSKAAAANARQIIKTMRGLNNGR